MIKRSGQVYVQEKNELLLAVAYLMDSFVGV